MLKILLIWKNDEKKNSEKNHVNGGKKCNTVITKQKQLS